MVGALVRVGIHTISAEDYHADPCERPSLSASVASIVCSRSPRHAWTAHPKLNPNFKRAAESKFDVGTAAHSILLEGKPPEQVVRVVYADAWRTNAAKDERDAARAEGFVPLLEKDADEVYAMLDAAAVQLAEHEAAPTPFTDGKPEQTLVWEEENGILCRALVDWLHDGNRAISDYKTTSASADPERWSRTAFTIGADIQTAFYLRGLRLLTGIHGELRYVVQETYPPYALSVCALSPAAVAVGQAKAERAIDLWGKCLEADHWPGYPTRVAYAELPPWEEARWIERESLREEQVA